MKSKWILAGIAIIFILGLSSCGRFKGGSGLDNSQAQPTPTAVLAQPALYTVTPTDSSIDNNPVSTQPVTPTLKHQSPTTAPTSFVTQPAADTELNKTATDLSDALNNLSKDLNSTDTMDDVK